MKHRNNLIKTIDRYLAGWDIVEDNKVNSFASDSDEGKKIRQAENRALSKLKTKKVNIFTFINPNS